MVAGANRPTPSPPPLPSAYITSKKSGLDRVKLTGQFYKYVMNIAIPLKLASYLMIFSPLRFQQSFGESQEMWNDKQSSQQAFQLNAPFLHDGD